MQTKLLNFFKKNIKVAHLALVCSIFLTAAAMYMSNNKLDEIEQQIAKATAQQDKNTMAINERWNVMNGLKNRLDTAEILTAVNKDHSITKDYLANNIAKYQIYANNHSNQLKSFEQIVKDHETLALNEIDAYYTENIKLKEGIGTLQKSRNHYKSVVQLFQVGALFIALLFGRAAV